MKFEFLMVFGVKITVFLDVAQIILVDMWQTNKANKQRPN